MKRLILLAVVVALCANVLPAADVARKISPQTQPRVEVAFVLDTTGSMGGLIAAAKAKIWYIANQIVLGDPKPIVRIALVAYRDKGDQYVTKVFDLTDNIDEVYGNLMKFKASGGGDGPENVNQALYDVTHKLSWSKDKKTLKIIYLVGDYPPHNEYKDVPTYDKTARAAIEKGIYINTILCGNNSTTRKIWMEIANSAEGTFLAISQNGGVREIPTPYDKDLAKLNRELLDTAVVYGNKKVRFAQKKLNTAAKDYSGAAAADRASFAEAAGKTASNDLVDDIRKNRVKLAKLKKDALPENMRKMSLKEQKKFIAENQAKRDKINAKIKDLSAKRAKFMKKELARTKGGKKGFDLKVVDSLKVQAARKGIKYK